MIALAETRVKAHNALKIQRKFGPSWQWDCNYVHSPRGRIWVGWRFQECSVVTLASSSQFIHCDLHC